MKKTTIILGLLVAASGFVSGAAELKVVAPNGGESWLLRSPQLIAWTAPGVTKKLKIVLFKDGRNAGRIAANLDPGSSPYHWNCGEVQGGTAVVAGGYKIYVGSTDNTIEDFSDAPFTLSGSDGGGMPDFQVSHMGCSPRVKNGAVQSVVVQLYVKNNGTEYNGPLTVHYICLDALVNSKISLDELLTLPSVSIPHGQWYGFVLCQPAWPAGVTAIHFGIMVDPGNLVNETNENNNYINYSYTLPPLDEIPQR